VQFKKQENAFLSYCERKLQASYTTKKKIYSDLILLPLFFI